MDSGPELRVAEADGMPRRPQRGRYHRRILNVTEAARAAVVTRLRSAGCVFAEEEADLLLRSASSSSVLQAWIRRRVLGEPLEVILGTVEFHGIQLIVRPGVFVPRRRSALLVRATTDEIRAGGTYLDLCTGTGAIAAAVRARRPDVRVLASDIDPRAVANARQNLPECWVGEGDLFGSVPARLRGLLDVITVSAPYVPAAELDRMPREAREHEPPHALVGGIDGLDVHRRVLEELVDWLAENGFALLECGEPQCTLLAQLCSEAGLSADVLSGVDGGYAVRAHR